MEEPTPGYSARLPGWAEKGAMLPRSRCFSATPKAFLGLGFRPGTAIRSHFKGVYRGYTGVLLVISGLRSI